MSFCYEEAVKPSELPAQKIKYFSSLGREELEKITVGIDRGVAIPVHCGDKQYDYNASQRL